MSDAKNKWTTDDTPARETLAARGILREFAEDHSIEFSECVAHEPATLLLYYQGRRFYLTLAEE